MPSCKSFHWPLFIKGQSTLTFVCARFSQESMLLSRFSLPKSIKSNSGNVAPGKINIIQLITMHCYYEFNDNSNNNEKCLALLISFLFIAAYKASDTKCIRQIRLNQSS